MSGGTNSNIKKQNKQIKKQYQYDKEFRTHQHKTNLDRYEESLSKVDLARDQEKANRNYRNKNQGQQYKYQKAIQSQEYQAQTKAFGKSESIYKQQIGFNKEAAALTLESEQRKLDEALLAASFDKKDLNIGHLENQATAKFDKEGTAIKRTDAKTMATLDKSAVTSDLSEKLEQSTIDQSKLESVYSHEGRAYTIQQAQMDRETAKIGSTEGWGLRGNQLEFQEAAAKNLANRIDNRVELIRTKGALIARGVEGNTATGLAQTALAEYGRKQADSALSLIFSSEKKSLSDEKVKGTATYSSADVASKKSLSTIGREKSTDILKLDKSKISVDTKFAKVKATNKTSKLDTALSTTLKQLTLSDTKTDSKLGFQTQRYTLGKEKIAATEKSAKKEFEASKEKLKLDQKAADLKAFGQKMIKPVKPPKVPKPLKLPKTIFIDPTKPRKPPKPIKGALGKTSVWNTVSDGLGALSSVASIAAPFVSDIKTKHTVEPIVNASTKLSNLKPVSFYYTPEYTADPDRLHHGFVAQEYKEVMPDATYDLKGTLAIDTNDLIGLLVKGHQELQEQIVQLENKLSATN